MSSQIQMIMGVSVGIFILPADLVQKRRMTVGFAVFLYIAFLPAIKSVRHLPILGIHYTGKEIKLTEDLATAWQVLQTT